MGIFIDSKYYAPPPVSRQLSKQHDFNFSDSDNERGEVGRGWGGNQFIKTTLSIVSYWVDNDLT